MSGICPLSSTLEGQYMAGTQCLEGPTRLGIQALGFTEETCVDNGGVWHPYDCSGAEVEWLSYGGWEWELAAVMQPIWASKCCRGSASFAETVSEDTCPELCPEGSFCASAAGCMDCVENRVYHPRACGGLGVSGLPAAVAAAVTACGVSCLDQSGALATDVPCGENRGPCRTSPLWPTS